MNHQAPERFIVIVSHDPVVSHEHLLRWHNGPTMQAKNFVDQIIFHGPALIPIGYGKYVHGFLQKGISIFLN